MVDRPDNGASSVSNRPVKSLREDAHEDIRAEEARYLFISFDLTNVLEKVKQWISQQLRQRFLR